MLPTDAGEEPAISPDTHTVFQNSAIKKSTFKTMQQLSVGAIWVKQRVKI